MTAVEKRFLTGFRSEDADTPGLVQEDDGTVWLVAPDGTRTQISGGGSSSLLSASVTLTDAQIRGLPTTSVVVIPATETPNYGPSLTKVPVVVSGLVSANNFAVAYSNVNAGAVLYLGLDSDQRVTWSPLSLAQVPLQAGDRLVALGPGGLTTTQGAGLNELGALPYSIVGNWHDNAVVVTVNNQGAGNFAGGDPSNAIRVTVFYVMASLAT